MSKFKKGDKIRALKGSGAVYFYTRGDDFVGTVIGQAEKCLTSGPGFFWVQVEASEFGGVGDKWIVHEKHFELAEPAAESFEYFAQSLGELVSENISLEAQMAKLRERLARKEMYFARNREEILGRTRGAV